MHADVVMKWGSLHSRIGRLTDAQSHANSNGEDRFGGVHGSFVGRDLRKR